MSILLVIWIVMLCAIYIFSYYEVTTQNQAMLNAHLSQYKLNMKWRDDVAEIFESEKAYEMNPMPSFPGMPSQSMPYFQNKPAFKLSTFYSVAVNYDGQVIEIRNYDEGVYSDKELVEVSAKLLKGKKSNGIRNNLIFSIVDKDGYILIGFMDNTIMHEGMMTLFRYTMLFGAVVIVALYFVAKYLARKIVEPLEESYRKQKQFISDAGHELKTPVSVVNANAELLSRELGENQWLSNIQYENERMDNLIAQLLKLARTDNVTPQMEKIDFSHLVKGEVLPFETVAFENGLMLNTHIADDIYVYGDGTQLRQLIAILVDNAICHGRNGREVEIVLYKEKHTVKLSVVNEGTEIPKEQREKIFERFYRTDDVRNSKENHYGLGLAIAKTIVVTHKGNIEVQCYDNKVKFVVTIPLLKNNKIYDFQS